MTRNEIIAKWESLTPRERDAWVAESMMGWSVERGRNYMYHDTDYVVSYTVDNAELDNIPEDLKDVTGALYYHPLPNFSTDIAAAWEVVDAMVEDDWSYALHLHKGKIEAVFRKEAVSQWLVGEGQSEDSTPEAICLAALIATLEVTE